MPTGRSRTILAVAGIAAMALGASAAPLPEEASPLDGRAIGSSQATTYPPTRAGCRVVLRGRGSYQLEVGVAGPVPVVTFKKATNPRFDQPRWEQGRRGSCNHPLGEEGALIWSPNSTPLLYTISTEINRYIIFEVAEAAPQYQFVYQRLNDLNTRITQGALRRGIQEGVAAVAAELISRYANPSSFLTDAGAKWVAEQAIHLMLQEFIAGRDPGRIIDDLLSRMVSHLRSQADRFLKAGGGRGLQQAVKPLLDRMAADLTKALVEVQPERQEVRVAARNAEDDCTHDYALWWELKGGAYLVELVVRCGEQTSGDVIRTVAVTSASVKPGDKLRTLTATALSQLGTAFPLGSASSMGIAAFADPSAEPVAGIVGTVATFTFDVAEPESDEVHRVEARLVSAVATGSLAGKGFGSVTVENVAPAIVATVPTGYSAEPGDQLELAPLRLTVRDGNADGSANGVREVQASSIVLTHPAELLTDTPLDRGEPVRRTRHELATGEFQFDVIRHTRVNSPHPHGVWQLGISATDAKGVVATTSIPLTVRDVPPRIAQAAATPEFVHRRPRQPIDLRIRVTDVNGFQDITGVRVDARAAGGGVYTLGDGLSLTGSDADWLDLKLETPFLSTSGVGSHDIPVEVSDQTGIVRGNAVLHVGNETPAIGGYGYLHGFDTISVQSVDDTHQKGVCPGERFRVGLIGHDPERDLLKVTATIIETGEQMDLSLTSENIYVGEMRAPEQPQLYTLRLDVTEVPPDKSTSTTMPLEVHSCTRPDDESRAAIIEQPDDDALETGQPFTPADIAAAPRDVTSQLQLGSFGGVIVDAVPANLAPGYGSGPSAGAILDSLNAILTVDGQVESYFISTGGSTGPVVQFVGLHGGETAVTMPRGVVVFEPVAIDLATQQRVNALLQRYVAAGGAVHPLNAYCLELLRQPPAAGTLLRLAAAPVQQRFERYQELLDAADRLAAGGLLHPDSDLDNYLHALRQWSIWTVEEQLDIGRFGEELVRTTRGNIEQRGGQWSNEIETAVRGLVPARWADIQAVLGEAGMR